MSVQFQTEQPIEDNMNCEAHSQQRLCHKKAKPQTAWSIWQDMRLDSLLQCFMHQKLQQMACISDEQMSLTVQYMGFEMQLFG